MGSKVSLNLCGLMLFLFDLFVGRKNARQGNDKSAEFAKTAIGLREASVTGVKMYKTSIFSVALDALYVY